MAMAIASGFSRDLQVEDLMGIETGPAPGGMAKVVAGDSRVAGPSTT